jgi:DNA-binding transcriptional MocR family regulator
MHSLSIKPKELLYQSIARTIEHQISHDVLKTGDKLPSIRMICRQHGVSMSTAQQAYYDLEKKSMIESRPQSGYYVSPSSRKQLAMPEVSKPNIKPQFKKVDEIFASLHNPSSLKDITMFSIGTPATELLPVPKLSKALLQAVREVQGSGVRYDSTQGNEKLRKQIAKWSFLWQGRLTDQDIITTAGCISSIAFCMSALTQRGDTIAVESPCFFGILQLARAHGLNVIEIPTHPQTGIELDALKKVIQHQKLKLVLLVSNFSNPLGSLMPDEHKKEVVRLISHADIPLVEDDIYGELYFGKGRPTCCKTFDTSGHVLWCSSVSKTLAPGYRVGWIAPGKYKEQVLKMKLYHTLSSPGITHEAIANFLENGRYETHLRKLRHTLHTTYLNYVRVIGESFPEATRLSRPQGGLSLWIELDKKINTLDLHHAAMKQKISIAPGSMFTLRDQYKNSMRLAYGMVWNESLENKLRLLGKLVKI